METIFSTKYFEEINFVDAKELLEWLNWGPNNKNFSRNSYVFRGENRCDYQLLPSSLRESSSKLLQRALVQRDEFNSSADYWQMSSEYMLLKTFYDLCDKNAVSLPEATGLRNAIHSKHLHRNLINEVASNEWLPEELHEVAGLAQHYGLPTRLIDWSYNFNVALYFASRDFMSGGKYRTLWVLLTTPFDAADSPLVFIRPAYIRNSYMSAQKGLFTLWKSPIDPSCQKFVDRETLDKKILGFSERSARVNHLVENLFTTKVLYKLNFFNMAIQNIDEYLLANGYNTSTIFPEMEGISRYILESSSPLSML
jgi:hypothetical protein